MKPPIPKKTCSLWPSSPRCTAQSESYLRTGAPPRPGAAPRPAACAWKKGTWKTKYKGIEAVSSLKQSFSPRKNHRPWWQESLYNHLKQIYSSDIRFLLVFLPNNKVYFGGLMLNMEKISFYKAASAKSIHVSTMYIHQLALHLCTAGNIILIYVLGECLHKWFNCVIIVQSDWSHRHVRTNREGKTWYMLHGSDDGC